MLNRNNVPYLFVIILGIFSWSLNTSIENAKQSPIIEYSNETKGGVNRLYISNLSSSVMLDSLEFSYCVNSNEDITGDFFSKVRIKAEPPSVVFIGEIPDEMKQGKCINFILTYLQPNSIFYIEYEVQKHSGTKLELLDAFKQPVRLIPKGLFSVLIKNQLTLAIWLFILSLLTLIVYSYYLHKNE